VDKPIKSMAIDETAIQDNGIISDTTADTAAMKSNSHLGNIVLDPVITITEAGSLYKNLQSYIDSEGDVTIDASKVQMIDMAGLQLLLVFSRELGKLQRKVQWQSPSSVFMQAAELMDLSRRLRLKNT
jgi:anti-anti-sigma regulatory factor